MDRGPTEKGGGAGGKRMKVSVFLNTSNKGQTPKHNSRQPKDTKSNSQSSHASTHTLITFLHLSVFLTFRRESV